MKYAKVLSILLLIILYTHLAMGQEIVSSEFLMERTAASIEAEYDIPAEYDIELYKVTYKTLDAFAVQDTASGLLIVPKDRNFKYPILSYSHGTVKDRWTGMSNLQAGDVNLAMIYGSFGFVVVAADYLGMNESRGFHPYVHAATEASASVDMLLGVKGFVTDNLGVHLNNLLFLTGYSQGGHACMATHRELEQNHAGEFEIFASIPMSGPYSISQKMIEFSLGDNPYNFTAYLPNTALSYMSVYPDLLAGYELEDFFKPDYVTPIKRFADGTIDLFQLNDILIDKLVLDHGASLPKFMVQDSTLENIKNNPNHPFSQALADNDVFDWAPKALTRLYYCESDDQVFYENSTLAEQVMLNNGASDIQALSLSDVFNHTQCVEPATTAAITLFFFTRGIVADNEEIDVSSIELGPNPFVDQILIDGLSIRHENPSILRIHDIDGKLLIQKTTFDSSYNLDVDHLNRGFYFIEIINDGTRSIHKLIKN